MIVCIAEKPSVGKDIATVIGATTHKHSTYWEGNGYQVTWTFGHLCELKEPHEYSPLWKTWSLGALPMIPPRFGIKLKKDKGIEEQFKSIEHLMQNADMIINCGDAGQEGELIQRWVMQKAGARCPVKRLWISSLTEEAIREGFNNLKDQSEYQSLYEAGLSRAIGDWTLGMNATRLYTLKYAQGKQVLSIGRVQTPTLALVVNRQLEIENFKPEPYWVLTTNYRDTTFTAVLEQDEENPTSENKTKNNDATRRGFKSEEEGRKALEQIKDSLFTVTSVSKKNGTEAPPRLYDLTSLQVECNKKFSFSADLTLQLIQSLYEKKVTTYPRVDTTFLSDDIYPKCKGILNGISSIYSELLQPLRGASLKKSKKVFDSSKVTDHHAIIPTGVAPKNLTFDEQRVYDLVARRFIAAFYPDCKFSTTTVLGETAEIPFKATGKQILEAGWKDVYSQEQKNEDDERKPGDEERTLPTFTKGESGPHIPDLAEKWTQAPKPYTEATLLRAMETAGRLVEDDELRDALKENGIGRPSTRAAIIQTLFKRHYIRLERKSLVATPTGVELISLIREELLKSAELTGIWEHKLRLIDKKAYDARTFLEELKQMVTDIVNSVLADNSNRRVTETKEETNEKKKKKVTSGNVTTKRTTRSKAKEKSAPETNIPKEGDKCPICGKGHIIKGKTAFGCSEWKNGCTYRLTFE
ncbi:MAG: DNA topoisomerase 3 [Paraprevotella sp.]|nr:DNA topoisomerase 3 [Paraprevotella sp.]